MMIGAVSVYHWIFEYSWIDAFYMTIITITTVGFGEVVPLSSEGKIFTSILILFSIFIFAYAVTTVSAYLVTINSVFNYNKRKMEKNIDKLSGHVIICGYGRNGRQAAQKLKSYDKEFVIIEQNKDHIEDVQREGYLYVTGNAIEDDTLIKAKIKKADFIISTLPSDSDNVFITLTAKQLNNKILVVSRASDESSIKKLKIAGADNIIMPDMIGGDHMASLIVAPDLIEFLDNLSLSTSGSMNIQEILLKGLPEIKTISQLKIKDKTGCTIIGYKTHEGDYIINPDADMPVVDEGRIIVLGNPLQIQRLNHVFSQQISKGK